MIRRPENHVLASMFYAQIRRVTALAIPLAVYEHSTSHTLENSYEELYQLVSTHFQKERRLKTRDELFGGGGKPGKPVGGGAGKRGQTR